MFVRRSLAAGLGLALLAPLAGSGTASAVGPVAADQVVSAAAAYLGSAQKADGGFELADFAGFETPDAIAALAAAVQNGPTWDSAFALQRISAIRSSAGHTPLDAIDDLIDGATEPSGDLAGGQAAKVVALVAAPLGLSVTDFDPSNDSSAPVDLVGRIESHRKPDGSYDFGAQFNALLYTSIALDDLGRAVPPALIAQITAAQRPDGSWNFAGDQAADSPGEIDTTAVAILALRAGGRTVADPAVNKAARFLAAGQGTDGAWQAFGASDPNSTSMAVIALSALGFDVTEATWARSLGAPAFAPYVSPYAWLRSQADASGRIKSPNDSYGINTFATSQTLEALSRQWYLRDERANFIAALDNTLASPSAAEDTSANLGPNPAIASARTAAAFAAVMSQSGREAAAAQLFDVSLHRRLDASGRAYWSNVLINTSRPEVLAQITGSPEFYARSGGTTASSVDASYQSVLGRQPDRAGKAYWVAQLDGGTSVAAVARSISQSREYRANQVDAAYQSMLGRPADSAGRNFWTDQLATTRVEGILAGLGGSAEFYVHHS